MVSFECNRHKVSPVTFRRVFVIFVSSGINILSFLKSVSVKETKNTNTCVTIMCDPVGISCICYKSWQRTGLVFESLLSTWFCQHYHPRLKPQPHNTVETGRRKCCRSASLLLSASVMSGCGRTTHLSISSLWMPDDHLTLTHMAHCQSVCGRLSDGDRLSFVRLHLTTEVMCVWVRGRVCEGVWIYFPWSDFWETRGATCAGLLADENVLQSFMNLVVSRWMKNKWTVINLVWFNGTTIFPTQE